MASFHPLAAAGCHLQWQRNSSTTLADSDGRSPLRGKGGRGQRQLRSKQLSPSDDSTGRWFSSGRLYAVMALASFVGLIGSRGRLRKALSGSLRGPTRSQSFYALYSPSLSEGHRPLLRSRSKMFPPWRTPSKSPTKAAAQFAAKELAAAAEDDGSQMTAMQAIVNMAKGIVGGGMLALPLGLAAMKRGPEVIVPAILFLVVPLGLLSAFTYYKVARICERTGARSYGAAWSKVMRGPLASMMSGVLVFSCGTGCVSYAMILGETVPYLLKCFFGTSFLTRSGSILTLTLTVFYPLSRLENLASLGKFSLLGNMGNAFVIIFMGLRYFQGAYTEGGKYPIPAETLAAPAVGSLSDMLILASILSTAFLGHFNAPNIFRELKAPPGQKVQRFTGVVLGGFFLAGALYTAVMVFGFLTFGNGCVGNVLDNYSPQDPLTGFAKVGVGISLLFGHPLLFMGCKDNVEALIGKQGRWLPVLLLSLATFMAVNIYDLGRMQALRGAVAGTFLCFTGPALMAASVSDTKQERAGHLSIALLGVLLCGAGLWASLK
mmetsp:Transcript_68804/g.165143  ORF Transcript_68804/g.165143 Transcript_68804/m.165143 type:complete len:548 (+) Transcript_68804:63-1706(+)